MNSPFANIYQALVAQLLTITSGDPATPVFYVDMDYGQLETHERPSVAFPCCLIDFKDWKYENAGALVQLAEGIICIKIATDPYAETSSITPNATVQGALAILDLEYQVFQAIQGFKAPTEYDDDTPPNATHGTTPFLRTYTSTDDRRPGLKVRHLYFTCSFTDESAARTYTTAPANPNITAQFTIPS